MACAFIKEPATPYALVEHPADLNYFLVSGGPQISTSPYADRVPVCILLRNVQDVVWRRGAENTGIGTAVNYSNIDYAMMTKAYGMFSEPALIGPGHAMALRIHK